ncbi:FKBP-type peptidyl-prolyl cis-trans isomerase [Streptomyces sp. NPDC002870]|uniref:FKBP-type peptidyl-prolyl cis-trans isomerase n=1 Tax=Streptomyces sp. NPDC002870 TaxID=3364666 RepID=UPI00368A0C8E
MRRIASLTVLPILLVAGCSVDEPPSARPGSHRPLTVPPVPEPHGQPVPNSVRSDTVLPAVTGKFGREAKIVLPKTNPTGKFVITNVLHGQGRKARNNDIVIVNYTARAWKRGEALPSTYGEGRKPLVFPVGQGTVIPALGHAVEGQRAGSRLLVVAPPAAAYGETGNAKLGISPTDTVVFVADIVKVIDAKSIVHGRQQVTPKGLPQVHADRSPDRIAVPDTAPPRRLVSRALVVGGSGPTVEAGQALVFQYSGAVWATNRGKEQATLFDSSLSQGSPRTAVIGRGNLIEGLDRALVGAKVGSRILLVIPPELSYGVQPQKGIPANSTLVFVVDILAAA